MSITTETYKNLAVAAPDDDRCIICGDKVEVHGRDLCFDCYSEAEGRGE